MSQLGNVRKLLEAAKAQYLSCLGEKKVSSIQDRFERQYGQMDLFELLMEYGVALRGVMGMLMEIHREKPGKFKKRLKLSDFNVKAILGSKYARKFVERQMRMETLEARILLLFPREFFLPRAKTPAETPPQPPLDALKDPDDSQEADKDTMIRVAQNLLRKYQQDNRLLKDEIKGLKERIKRGRVPSKDDLLKAARQCLHKNGKINKSLLGRRFGVTHHTVGTYLRQYGIE